MDIFLEKTNETRTLSFSGSVSDLLAHLTIQPEEVIVARNNTLVPFDTVLTDSDSVKILWVISGG